MLDLTWPFQRHQAKRLLEVCLRKQPVRPVGNQAASTDVVGELASALLGEGLSCSAFDSSPHCADVRRHTAMLAHGFGPCPPRFSFPCSPAGVPDVPFCTKPMVWSVVVLARRSARGRERSSAPAAPFAERASTCSSGGARGLPRLLLIAAPETRHEWGTPSQVDGTPREMNLMTWSGRWPGQNACIAHVPPASSRSANVTPGWAANATSNPSREPRRRRIRSTI